MREISRFKVKRHLIDMRFESSPMLFNFSKENKNACKHIVCSYKVNVAMCTISWYVCNCKVLVEVHKQCRKVICNGTTILVAKCLLKVWKIYKVHEFNQIKAHHVISLVHHLINHIILCTTYLCICRVWNCACGHTVCRTFTCFDNSAIRWTCTHKHSYVFQTNICIYLVYHR